MLLLVNCNEIKMVKLTGISCIVYLPYLANQQKNKNSRKKYQTGQFKAISRWCELIFHKLSLLDEI